MVVQHNLTAMNSNRNLGLTTASQAKSTEKLSSGYKINRAADDAAGLSISEKMRKQIRGLTQASSNAEDGISAVQTAEGALNEVQDMLQRMNELAVKASNGTMSENDRSYVQNEVDALIDEIDRVSETTKFNETYLLKGDKDAAKEYSFTYQAADDTVAYGTGLDATSFGTVTGGTAATAVPTGTATFTGTYTGTTDQSLTYADGTETAGTGGGAIAAGWYTTASLTTATTGAGGAADLVAGALTGLTADTAAVKGDTLALTAATGGTYTAFTTEDELLEAVDAGTAIYKGDAVTAATAGTDYTVTEGATKAYYDKDGNKIAKNALDNYVNVAADGATLSLKTDAPTIYTDAEATTAVTNADLATDVTPNQNLTGSLTLKLHVGADSTDNNQISVKFEAMSAKGLGVDELKVDGDDDTNAKNAIDTIKEAIQKVSTQRSALGAAQNRLEHTINNLDNVVENTTSAESAIRDTDMATEMVKYSNNNILSQAGQAMLAQANQSNQGVLSLLQ